MIHCSPPILNSIPAVFNPLAKPHFTLTSPSRHLPSKQAIRHSICLPRAYLTHASPLQDVPPSAPALVPQYRSVGIRPSKASPYSKLNLALEIRWLKDPARLADHTVQLLRGDDHLKALELVSLASKDMKCTVSWNHLIDYEMSKARVSSAIKLYNEVSSSPLRLRAYEA